MTSPDRFSPNHSYGVSSTSGMQSVTREDIAAQANADILELLDQLGLTWLHNLLGGFSNIVQAITSAINKFISDLVYALKGITGGLIDLTGFLSDSRDKANQAQTASQSAVSAAETAANLAGRVHQQVSVKVSLSDIRTDVPLWQTLNTQGFSTFPRSQLIYLRSWVSGTTGPASGTGTGHTHTFPTLGFENLTPFYAVQGNQQKIGVVRAEKDSVIGQVSWLGAPSIAGTTGVYVRAWRMSPADGSLAPLIDESPNLYPTHYEGFSTELAREITYTFPEAILVESGDLLVFGIRSVGSHKIVGAEIWVPPQQEGVFPPGIGGSLSLSQGTPLPASPNYSSINWVETFQIYACFQPSGEESIQKRVIFDNFDRKNGALGERWRVTSTASLEGLRIRNGKVEWAGFDDGNDGHSTATYRSPLATDTVDGRVVVGRTEGSRIAHIIFRGKSDMTRGAVIGFSSSRLYLGYKTGSSSFTYVQTTDTPIGAGSIIEWAVVDTSYVVYVNGVLKLSFSMPLSQVPSGPGARYFAIRSGRSDWIDWPTFDSVYCQDTPEITLEEDTA